MLLKLIPDETSIRFTKRRYIAFAFSGALIVGSIIALMTMGLNFGIDFRGGVTIEVEDAQPLDVAAIRDAVSDLDVGNVNVQLTKDFVGTQESAVVYIERQEATDVPEGEDQRTANEQLQQANATKVQDALQKLLGDDMVVLKRDVVGPTVSSELIEKGIIAVVLAIGMMLVYIWFRFEWQFGVGSIIALAHDVTITLGMFAVTQLKFELSVIAALLTIVGYSMNDTVVVYDRVRENLRKYKQKPLAELLDISINDTLTRTVMTSGTTLLALISLAIFGGQVLRGFTMAIIWGIVIGTYSSIFVASPFLLFTGVKRDWSKQPATATP